MRVLSLLINLVPYHVARWGAVVERGHEVTVLQWRADDDFKVLEATRDGLPFSLVTLAKEDRQPMVLLRFIEREVAKRKPDVIFVSGWKFPLSLAGILVGAQCGVPVVICSESNRWDAARNAFTEWIKSRVVKMCVAGLAGGGPQQDYLVELGMPKAGVFLGYNVVDNAHFASRGGLEKWRGDVGGRFLVAASRFTVKKNLAALVRGFSEFARKKPESDLRLVIAGDGPLWNEVAGVVAECGMRGRVQLLGAVGYPEMPGLYAAASGFIHASTIEQWGLVVNEAMAAGLPVLVSERCGCAENLVAEGVNGKAFDPSSLSGIADVIEWFDSLSREYLGKMGEASRRVISSNGPKAFADGMEGASCYAIQKGSAKLGLIDSALLRVLLVLV